MLQSLFCWKTLCNFHVKGYMPDANKLQSLFCWKTLCNSRKFTPIA